MKEPTTQEIANQEEIGTGRIEAFSDGVFAVAITLLILNLRVPEEQGKLLIRMGQQWPHYLSFLLSFLIVGVVWGNHHTMFSYIKRSNHMLIVLNLLLLLSVAVIAFTADLLGLYIGKQEQWVAVMIYSGCLVAGGIFYNLLWLYASRGHRLLDSNLPDSVVHQLTRRYLAGPLLYVLALLLSFPIFWNGTPGLIVCILLAIGYLLPTFADRIKASKG